MSTYLIMFIKIAAIISLAVIGNYTKSHYESSRKSSSESPTSGSDSSGKVYITENITGRNGVRGLRIIQINSTSDELHIPERINGKPVLEIKGGVPHERDDSLRNSGNHTLKKLWIPDTVEKISRYSFFKCWDLQELFLPDNDELVLEEDSFWGCKKLHDVHIPKGKAPDHYKNAFGGCPLLKFSSDSDKITKKEPPAVILPPRFSYTPPASNTPKGSFDRSAGIFRFDEKIKVLTSNTYFPRDTFQGIDTVILPENIKQIKDLKIFCRFKNIIIRNEELTFIPRYNKTILPNEMLHPWMSPKNLIFETDGKRAVFSLAIHYSRNMDELTKKRAQLFTECLKTQSSDNKFFNVQLYDSEILDLLPSVYRKLDVCYYRLSSQYRLSQANAEKYESFIRSHYKKALFQAVKGNDTSRINYYLNVMKLDHDYLHKLENQKKYGKQAL